MPPQSRGRRLGSYSLSTPDLPTLKTLRPLDTSYAAGLPDNVTSARSLQAQRNQPLFSENERFPDLDGGDELPVTPEEPLTPQSAGVGALRPPTFTDGDAGDSSEEEEEEAEDEDDSSNPDDRTGSEIERRTQPTDLNTASDSDSDEGSSSDQSSNPSSDPDTPSELSDATPHANTTTPAPSTLRVPHSSSGRLPSPASSSADSSPRKPHPRPVGPNRSQSLYTQPSYTKSHSSIPSFHQSLSRGNLNPAAFAPPFYNRPPTPLPPSPSLTSLLRPLPFSTLPSRPTSRPPTPGTRTPVDSSSDTEFHHLHPATTEASAAHSTTSLLPTTPPVAPKIPTYEYYGFTLYVTSLLAGLAYIFWSFTPTPFLHLLGIYYYPNRWWALAVPAWFVMGLVWIYVALSSYNTGTLTLAVGDLGCMVDEKGRVAALTKEGVVGMGRHGPDRMMDEEGSKGGTTKGKRAQKAPRTSKERGGIGRRKKRKGQEPDWRELWSHGTDGVLDVPIGAVCEVLYGEGRESEEDHTLMGDGTGMDGMSRVSTMELDTG